MIDLCIWVDWRRAGFNSMRSYKINKPTRLTILFDQTTGCAPRQDLLGRKIEKKRRKDILKFKKIELEFIKGHLNS